MKPLVDAVKIHKAFHGVPVLAGVDLKVLPGQVVCLLGPSGSGKTTLLRCLNQLETIDQGLIYIDGILQGYVHKNDRLYRLKDHQIAAQRRDIGMVFQRFNLFPHLNVLRNITVAPISVKGLKPADAMAAAADLLAQVGLADRAQAYPAQLSGGQQQRVAIARALAMHPKLLLFDEPTSALDPELVGEVLAVMRRLAAGGMTMVVVTHEMQFARDVADWVVVLDSGKVIEQGPAAQVLDAPQHPRTQAFLGRVKPDGPCSDSG